MLILIYYRLYNLLSIVSLSRIIHRIKMEASGFLVNNLLLLSNMTKFPEDWSRGVPGLRKTANIIRLSGGFQNAGSKEISTQNIFVSPNTWSFSQQMVNTYLGGYFGRKNITPGTIFQHPNSKWKACKIIWYTSIGKRTWCHFHHLFFGYQDKKMV